MGVDALGALVDGFLDVQIGDVGELGFALFQQLFDGFPLEADHAGHRSYERQRGRIGSFLN